jgi:Flp pilus assembly protein TadD
VEILPHRADAHRLLGVALARSGAADAGIASLRQALELAPLDAAAMRDLATALAARGDREEALELVRRAVEADREHTVQRMAENQAAEIGLLTAQGLYEHRRGDHAAAVATLRQAAALAPDDPVVLLNLGLAYAASGDQPAAIGALEHAAQIAPERAAIHTALARSYAATGRHEDALRAEHRARELGVRVQEQRP